MSLRDKIVELEEIQSRLEDQDKDLKYQIEAAENALLNGDSEPRRLLIYISGLQDSRINSAYQMGLNDGKLQDLRRMLRASDPSDNLGAAASWHDKKETISAARVPEEIAARNQSEPAGNSELDWLSKKGDERDTETFARDKGAEKQNRSDDLDWLRRDLGDVHDKLSQQARERDR